MERDGGGGAGLKAHTSAPPAKHRSGAGGASVASKKTVTATGAFRKPPPGRGRYYNSAATMYKCDGTVRSVNTTAGMTMGGKSLAADGKVSNQPLPGAARAVMNHSVDAPIGGALAFSQVDQWIDKSLNNRASCDLWVSNGVTLAGGNLDCRPSSRDPEVLVITFGLSSTFTNPDLKFGYLVERVMKTYKLENDKNQAMKILQNHPRYIAAKVNLQSLLGSRGDKAYLVEYRIRAPFPIHDDLVTDEEDKVFFGYHMEVNEDSGENHIHFELKERKKAFKPVVVDGVVHSSFSVARGAGQRKSMFASGAVNMVSIPEHISFQSPNPRLHKAHDDDSANSTIPSDEKKPKAKPTTKPTKTTPAVKGDEDEDEFHDPSYDPNMMDVTITEEEVELADKSDVTDLQQKYDSLFALFQGFTQQNMNGHPSSPASTPKRQKDNHGSAASVAGSAMSRRSTNMRGSHARNAKRKSKIATADGGGSESDEFSL